MPLHPPTVTEASVEERAAVLNVLERFTDGLRERDISIWDDLFYPKIQVYAFRKDGNGDWVPNFRDKEGMFAILEMETQVLDLNYWQSTVLIRGPVAQIWTPYEFTRSGTPAHMGIDSFSLVKIGSGWKIFNIVFTVEAGACPDLAKGRS